MNDRIHFEQLVQKPDCDKLTKRVFIDWLMEFQNYSWRFAARIVCKIARDARNTRELAEAGKYLAEDSPFYVTLMDLMCEADSTVHDWWVDVIVVPGSRPPLHVRKMLQRANTVVIGLTVYVGARWVIRAVDYFLSYDPTEVDQTMITEIE